VYTLILFLPHNYIKFQNYIYLPLLRL